MNSNINDPVGIAALLDQLKSSAAWQELTSTSTSTSSTTDSVPLHPESLASSSATLESSAGLPIQGSTLQNSSVASLLSQLNSRPSEPPRHYALQHDLGQRHRHVAEGPSKTQPEVLPSISTTHPTSTRVPNDLTKLSFREALPMVSALVDDKSFVEQINKMRSEQDALERRLWLDREAIYGKYQEKIKVAENKAQMIGVVISQHELNMITDAFKKELAKFDKERVIPAWDGLASRQQQELAQLKVPTMCVTGDTEHLQRQKQVVQLLESLVGPKGPNPVV